MRKIPTLYVRDAVDRSQVTSEVTRGCEWVLAGEGKATRKYDGTCMMRDDDGRWWARREVKPGRGTPFDFVPISHDEVTGKTVGWEPAAQSAFSTLLLDALGERNLWEPGTYELIGPKINGNPEGVLRHVLMAHGHESVVPVDFNISPREVVLHFARLGWEGIVWHHPDGRMAKLKARDLGARV